MANTDAPQARRSERGAQNIIPIVVALVAVGGFLAWLATRQPTANGVAVAEPGQNEAPAGNAQATTGTAIEPAQLAEQGGRPLVGQDVEVTAPVTSAMGQNFVWIELPGGAPYLVRLDPSLVQAGQQPPMGRPARIVGRVENKDDAVLNQWTQDGVLQDEGHRMQAEFGVTYIHARLIEPAAN